MRLAKRTHRADLRIIGPVITAIVCIWIASPVANASTVFSIPYAGGSWAATPPASRSGHTSVNTAWEGSLSSNLGNFSYYHDSLSGSGQGAAYAANYITTTFYTQPWAGITGSPNQFTVVWYTVGEAEESTPCLHGSGPGYATLNISVEVEVADLSTNSTFVGGPSIVFSHTQSGCSANTYTKNLQGSTLSATFTGPAIVLGDVYVFYGILVTETVASTGGAVDAFACVDFAPAAHGCTGALFNGAEVALTSILVG